MKILVVLPVIAVLATSLTSRADFVNSTATGSENGPKIWRLHSSGRANTFKCSRTGALQFSVIPGDVWSNESPENRAERSEVVLITRMPIGRDFWFGFDIKPISGVPSKATWSVIGQLHHSPNKGDRIGSPPLAAYLAGNTFSIRVRHSDEIPLANNPKAQTIYSDSEFTVGRLYRFVYHVRYDSQRGFVKVWRNGVRVAAYDGPLGYPSTEGPYLKFGIYRSPSKDMLKVEYSNIAVGLGAPETGRVENTRSVSGLAPIGQVRAECNAILTSVQQQDKK